MAHRVSTRSMIEPGDAVPVALDIYEREQFNAEGMGGDVYSDIADLSLDDMEAYFGDQDPVAFL